MTLTQKSRYHLESECGLYTVAKIVIDKATRYEAWRRTSTTPEFLASFATADGAKAKCRRDAAKRLAEAA